MLNQYCARFYAIFCSLFAAWTILPVCAQPLPKVALRPILPALKLDRALWMSEVPDGSGRLFIAEQDGRILVVPKGSDGAEATEFLNITDRKPHADNNNVGLLGMALHPGFKTNGLCYVYYSQLNTNTASHPRRFVISEFKASATDPHRVESCFRADIA